MSKKVTQKQLKTIIEEIGFDIYFYRGDDVSIRKVFKKKVQDLEIATKTTRQVELLSNTMENITKLSEMLFAIYEALGYEYEEGKPKAIKKEYVQKQNI